MRSVECHKEIGRGFLVISIEHLAGEGEGVEMVAGGEAIDVIFELVAFVQVFDCGTEIDGIGGVGLQILLELDDHRLATQLDVGLLLEKGGEEHVLAGVVEGHILVEGKLDPLAVEAHAVIGRHGLRHLGRRDILGSSCRRDHVGASREKQCG